MTATYVTQPCMPPLAEFVPYLETIWRNRWLTNAGPLHEQLEAELAAYLGVEQIALVANGTVALTLALQALDLDGDVITTPFSFVATSNAIRASGLRPVFADIDPVTFNLDPRAVEAAITSRTAAILPVHCFGQPCDLDGLAAVARRHALPLVYDAAHAFAVKRHGMSVLREGTVSTLSFHATKVFSTFEGGAIVCRDRATKDRIAALRNFGFTDAEHVGLPGINGKMSEIHAAFGLLQLKHFASLTVARKRISMRYRQGLGDIPGITVPPEDATIEGNHGYFPILVGDAFPLDRDGVFGLLKAKEIFARRYFYPLIPDMPAYRQSGGVQHGCATARAIADRILCLPIYPHLSETIVDEVITAIRGAIPSRSAA